MTGSWFPGGIAQSRQKEKILELSGVFFRSIKRERFLSPLDPASWPSTPPRVASRGPGRSRADATMPGCPFMKVTVA
jgi:hypothetical protein